MPEPKTGAGVPDRSAAEKPLADEALPRGMRWRITTPFTRGSRQRRLAMFMALLAPGPADRLLDVGVTDTDWRASNFLEGAYPWPHRITAVTLMPAPTFERLFPLVTVVVADGRRLPFEDQTFEVGFSNAVLEHVGSRSEQRQFIAELIRTCRQVFIATPNAAFPVDPHTLLPLVHWLPRRLRDKVLTMLGQVRWAGESNLNPLRASDLLGLFPEGVDVRLVRQRVWGLTTVLIAVARSGALRH